MARTNNKEYPSNIFQWSWRSSMMYIEDQESRRTRNGGRRVRRRAWTAHVKKSATVAGAT